MSPPKPQVHVHDHRSWRTSLLSLLQSQLPYSGPLLRRIQYDRRLDPPSSTSAICLATFAPETTPRSLSGQCDGDGTPGFPWLAAYVDMHSWPETQVWMYSSLEPWSKHEIASTDLQNNGGKSSFVQAEIFPAAIAETQAQLLLLLSYIRTELVPTYLRSLEADSKIATSITVPETSPEKANAVPQIAPHPRTAILTGSLHSGLVELLETASTTTPSLQRPLPKVHVPRTSHPPYVKYLFPRSKYAGSHHNAKLPPGYRFHDRHGRHGYQSRHWDLIMSRTHIPRSKKRLAAMASAVVYHDQSTSADLDKAEDPIAWGFLGLDGSLMLLHVEPEHRGRGLAVLVGQEVMRIGMMGESAVFGLDEDEEERWVFADVALDNIASRRVMEKMGGKPAWTLGWVVSEVCLPGECHCCADIPSNSTVRQS